MCWIKTQAEERVSRVASEYHRTDHALVFSCGAFLRRGMTLGVRAACFDEEGRIFLVRHTYISGWHMPGGSGVERQETGLQPLPKEIREEDNLVVTSAPKLVHLYFNNLTSDHDHVLFCRLNIRQTV